MEHTKKQKQYLNGRFKINVIWCLIFKYVLEETHVRKIEGAAKELNTTVNTNNGP